MGGKAVDKSEKTVPKNQTMHHQLHSCLAVSVLLTSCLLGVTNDVRPMQCRQQQPSHAPA